MKQRIITGIGLLAFIGFLTYFNNLVAWWIFWGIAYIIALNESTKLWKATHSLLYFVAICVWIQNFFVPFSIEILLCASLLFMGMQAYFAHNHTVQWERLVLPLLYPSIGFVFIFGLYARYGIEMLVWLVVLVAIADTFAYFTGKAIGKTPFSPSSPNKTLEGVIGGVVFATIIGSYFGVNYLHLSTPVALIISLCVAFSSVFGDLFESYLKRLAGVKDSGNLLPGHGGVLDRTDGYLFGAIILAMGLKIVG